MTRTPLGSRLTKTLLSIHFFTHGSGASVLIRIAGRKSCGGSGRKVVVSGNTLVDGRPREHNANSTEFKFVFKSLFWSKWHEPQISSPLMSSLSKMRTGTSERSAAEFWLIPMECAWVKSKDKSKNKEHRTKKGQYKRRCKENPKSGGLTELRSNSRKWSHNVASCWHGKEKQVNRVRNRVGTVNLSSSSSTLVATDADTKRVQK